MKRYRKLTLEERAEATHLYSGGATLGELGRHFGCSPETIRKLMIALGVPVRTGGGKRRRCLS